jgi:NADH dehydrogenase
MLRPRVVIVGAGFGGISAARALAHVPVDVTIVDQHNFHTFSPLLYQVATSSLAPDDIAPNLRGIVRDDPHIEGRMNTVRGVDFERREVLVDRGTPIPYDNLILAAGAVSSDFGVPGVAEHAIPLKTLADATRIRSTILDRFEAANAEPSLADDGALTFLVAGGGPTGVELSGALAELIANVLAKDFKGLDVGRARVVLVEMTDHVLGAFSPRSRTEALVELAARNVDVRLGVPIAAVARDKVELADGTTIPTHTVLWTAGVKANPVANSLSLAQTRRGEIVVRPDLSVPGHPEVFVIGDLAAVERPGGKPFPQLAPVAMQQGRYVARCIERRIQGRTTKPFRYVDKGTMATIGRRSAVAELPLGIRFGGTLGWLSWLGLHLVFLIGFRNRAVVLLNWAWNYVRWDHANRVILSDPEE